MAGWMVGSVLLTWILCSALNTAIEKIVIDGVIERSRGFLFMVLGLMGVSVGMLFFCLRVYPHSAQAATMFLSDEQAQTPARLAAFVNGLFVLGFAGFQLRRYWEDD